MNLLDKVRGCEACSLRKNIPEGCSPLFGTGFSNADVVIVLDGPNYMDIMYNTPIYGAPLDYLYLVAGKAGIHREKIFITTMVKCSGPIKVEHIRTCSQHLVDQLHAIQPTAIVTLGTKANKLDNCWPKCATVFRGKSPKYIIERGKTKRREFENLFKEVAECLNQKVSK